MKSILCLAAIIAALAFGPAEAANVASVASGGDNSLVQQINVPRQCHAGQVLIVVVMISGDLNQGEFFFEPDGPISPPAGFSTVDDTAFGGFQSTNGYFIRMVTSNEPAEYQFTWPVATTDQWVSICVNGAIDSAIVVQETDFNESTATVMVAPSVSASHTGDLLLCVWGIDVGDIAPTPPAGMNVVFSGGSFNGGAGMTASGGAFVVASQIVPAGNTGTRKIVGTSQSAAVESSRATSVAFH